MRGKQYRSWSDTTFCQVWSGYTLFVQTCLHLIPYISFIFDTITVYLNSLKFRTTPFYNPLIYMYLKCWMIAKQCRPWTVDWLCGVWFWSVLVIQACPYQMPYLFPLNIRIPKLFTHIGRNFTTPIYYVSKCRMINKQCRLCSDAAFCIVWSASTLFVHVFLQVISHLPYIWTPYHTCHKICTTSFYYLWIVLNCLTNVRQCSKASDLCLHCLLKPVWPTA